MHGPCKRSSGDFDQCTPVGGACKSTDEHACRPPTACMQLGLGTGEWSEQGRGPYAGRVSVAAARACLLGRPPGTGNWLASFASVWTVQTKSSYSMHAIASNTHAWHGGVQRTLAG
jgi:hypothetical protein